MKCLVTGAAGFIGSHLCERLISDGHTVYGFDNLSTGRLENLESLETNQNFHFIPGNVIDGSVFDDTKVEESLHQGVDWFFHLAAKADVVPSIENPTQYHDVNVTGTIRMLQAARSLRVKRFVYAASSSCYGISFVHPTSETERQTPEYPYALTKAIGEQYVMHWAKVYGLPAISLRLFNIYGPRSRTSGAYGAVFGVFLSQMANNSPITIVGDGEQKRDFTYVTDVVDAFVRAASSEQSGIAINIGSGVPQTINRLADILGASDRVYMPKRPGEPHITWADNRLALNFLDWSPKVSFEEGISIMNRLTHEYKDAPLWTKETIAKATESWFKHLGG